MSRRIRFLLPVCLPLLLSAACDRSAKTDNGPEPEVPKPKPVEPIPPVPPEQSSPERLVKEFHLAATGRDWGRVFDYITDDSQDALLDEYIRTAEVFSADDEAASAELKRILADHKVKDWNVDGPKRYEDAPNFSDLFADVDHWAIDDAARRKEPIQATNLALEFTAYTLGKFQVDGDAAVAEWVHGEDDLGPARFVRVDGAWYVDLVNSFHPASESKPESKPKSKPDTKPESKLE